MYTIYNVYNDLMSIEKKTVNLDTLRTLDALREKIAAEIMGEVKKPTAAKIKKVLNDIIKAAKHPKLEKAFFYDSNSHGRLQAVGDGYIMAFLMDHVSSLPTFSASEPVLDLSGVIEKLKSCTKKVEKNWTIKKAHFEFCINNAQKSIIHLLILKKVVHW